ncbi:MAG: hypothetical protein ACLP2E_20200, partial [Rhodoblastus sp.]
RVTPKATGRPGYPPGDLLKPWTKIMLSEFRSTLAPILSVNPLGRNMMPDVSEAELDRIKATAHFVVADVVTVLHRRCAKNRSASRRLVKLRAGRRDRQA